METAMHHAILVGQYHALISILDERGISFDFPSDAEVDKLSDTDLSRLIKVLRDTARTPGVGR